MKEKLKSIKFIIGSFLVVIACDSAETGKEGGSKGNRPPSLETSAESCGDIVSIGAIDDTGQSPRSLTLTYQMALCGKVGDNPDASWKALGVTVEATKISVQKSKTNGVFLAGGEGELAVNGQNQVLLVRAGSSEAIGEVTSTEQGYPINLKPGISIKVLVNGQPYKVGHPDNHAAEKTLVLNLE